MNNDNYLEGLFEGTYRVTEMSDSLGRTHVEIQNLDADLALLYAQIMKAEYERKGFECGNIEQEFIGILGEHVVQEALRTLGIKFTYAGTWRHFWEHETRSADFEIIPNGALLEICTTPPPDNCKNCLVKQSKLDFRWDYTIGVKIVSLKCVIQSSTIHIDGSKYGKDRFFETLPTQVDTQTPIGKAIIYGYGTRQEIENASNGWQKSNNDYPCWNAPCIWKPLDKLERIDKLWENLRCHSK